MKRAMAWLCAMAFVLALTAGCTSKGTIQADAIETLVVKVSERHDQYVSADPSLTPEDKADFLRSTELLRKVVETATSSATPTSEPR